MTPTPRSSRSGPRLSPGRPSLRWPSARWLSLRWLSLRWLSLRWLSLRRLSLRWLSLRWLSLRWLSLRWLSLRWLSLRWLSARRLSLRWMSLEWLSARRPSARRCLWRSLPPCSRRRLRPCPRQGRRPGPEPAVDVRRLRYPAEPSRFALAASASILLIGLGLLLAARLAGVRWLAGAAALAVIALGSCWCWAQAYRAHLLGRAAQVTPDTFPVLSAAISEVRQQLGYLRPADVFVSATARRALLTSTFGPHVLVIRGDLAADLSKPGNRAQLDFALATFFGRLKARSLAWPPARVAIDVLRLSCVLNVLVAPWDRAIVYTGDQVAAACCGSLDESVIALSRLLATPDCAASADVTGLLRQAASVRRRRFRRLPLLYARSPRLTDRYLNLLSFAGHAAPQEARAFHQQRTGGTDRWVWDVLARPAPRHRHGPRRTLAAVPIAVSVLCVAAAGYGLFSPVYPHLLAVLERAPGPRPAAAAAPVRPSPGPSASAAPSASSVFPDTPTDAVAALETHVPAAFAGSCASFTPQPVPTGLVAAVTCTPTGSGAPAHLEYYQYATAADLNGVFSHDTQGVPVGGTCDQGGQRGTYHFAAGSAGTWACFSDIAGMSQMIWTSTRLDILATANDHTQTPQQLSNWFFSPAETGPR